MRKQRTDRRRVDDALREFAGALTGAFEPDHVEELRAEWPERRRFVPGDALVAGFRTAPDIDAHRFRADVDAVLDTDPTPRA